MASSHGCSSGRPDRKTIEKNRRIHMKALYSKLISLLPTPTSKEAGVVGTLPEQLDEAINYIKGMQELLERMRKRKRQLMGSSGEVTAGLGLPKIEVQESSSGGGLRVMVVSGPSDHQLLFWEVVRALEAEGIEVVTASYAVVGDKAFHTIQSSPRDQSRVGEAGKVLERLKKAISMHA